MQYALLDMEDSRIHRFSSRIAKEFRGENHFVLDSMEIESEEIKLVQGKNKVKAFCPVCGEQVFFRKEHIRDNLPVHAAWVHTSDDELCTQSEGVAHAMTKRFLFDRLREKGYRVQTEKVHRFGERSVRADVAVLEQENETLKLVVEVQASDTTIREVEKRTYAYYQESAPVAWVLLIDSFFDRYRIERDRERDIYDLDGTPDLEPDREYPFYLTGKDNAVFDLLMNRYFYVIGIRDNGQVLLIRRSPELARQRVEAEDKGKELSTTEDHYLASLIVEDKIASVLMQTPLIYMEYEPSMRKNGKKKEGIIVDDGVFKGKDCLFMDDRRSTIIDFEGGRTESSSLDPLELIRQTEEAIRLEREERVRIQREREERIKREEEERKRLEEEERQRAEKKRLDAIESERKLQERRKLIAEKRAEREREKEQKKREEERRQKIERIQAMEQNHPLNDYSPDPPETKPTWGSQSKPYGSLKEVQDAMEQAKLRSLKLYREQEERDQQKKREQEYRAQLIERAYNEEVIPELWEEYERLEPSKRGQWERMTWYRGVEPPWFTSKKKPLLKKEHELISEEKRRLAREKKIQEEEKPKPPSNQLSLFD